MLGQGRNRDTWEGQRQICLKREMAERPSMVDTAERRYAGGGLGGLGKARKRELGRGHDGGGGSYGGPALQGWLR